MASPLVPATPTPTPHPMAPLPPPLPRRPPAQVLAADAAEDERSWADVSGEEAEVQRQVAEAIWDELLVDTAEALAGLERQLAGGGQGGRRRM